MTTARVVLAAAILLGGCAGPKVGDQRPPGETPELQTLVERHETRMSALQTLHLYGVLELEFAGQEQPQGDVDIYIGLPLRTAMRVSKAGEVIAWIGSDEQRYWFFDLISEPSTADVAAHDEPLLLEGDEPLELRPKAFLHLLGLVSLADRELRGPVWSSRPRGWTIEFDRPDGVTSITFNDATFMPVAVSMLDRDGAELLSSTLEQYRPIDMHGVSPLAAPHVPQVTRIASDRGLKALLVVRENEGPVDAAKLDRLTGFDQLVTHFDPDIVRR